ncbi:MAG: dihydroorotate dehydrogenase [bacterium]
MTIENHDLDELFAVAADHCEIPPASLVAKILADADALQPKPAIQQHFAPRSWFATLADFFGGGLSLAGMSVAAMAGLYIGVAQPTPLVDLTNYVTGSSQSGSLELLPSTSVLWAQE